MVIKYPRGFEKVTASTIRLKVFGGWMVVEYADEGGLAAVFIPDPKHLWILEDEKKKTQ